jgi:hypothetical protein
MTLILFNHSTPPAYPHPQQNEPYPDIRRLLYLDTTLVNSLTTISGVPKWDGGIFVVLWYYLLGLHATSWASWFCLPASNSLVRVVEEGTFNGDNNIGEIYLNFFKGRFIHLFYGLDLIYN